MRRFTLSRVNLWNRRVCNRDFRGNSVYKRRGYISIVNVPVVKHRTFESIAVRFQKRGIRFPAVGGIADQEADVVVDELERERIRNRGILYSE